MTSVGYSLKETSFSKYQDPNSQLRAAAGRDETVIDLYRSDTCERMRAVLCGPKDAREMQAKVWSDNALQRWPGAAIAQASSGGEAVIGLQSGNLAKASGANAQAVAQGGGAIAEAVQEAEGGWAIATAAARGAQASARNLSPGGSATSASQAPEASTFAMAMGVNSSARAEGFQSKTSTQAFASDGGSATATNRSGRPQAVVAKKLETKALEFNPETFNLVDFLRNNYR